jgi:hypothetical protein
MMGDMILPVLCGLVGFLCGVFATVYVLRD